MLLAAGLMFGACEQELNPNDPGNLVPMTVDQDPTLPNIEVNGTRLHAQTFGQPDSAIIIMIHGGPGVDYRSMLHAQDLAGEGYFVVFYDQRGTGLSQRYPKEIYNLQIMKDDLGAIIQKYRKRPDQKVFLFGHSWGAMLATAYINDHPEQISGAVLAEPGGFTWEDTKAYLERLRPFEPFSEEASDVLYFDQFLTGKEDQHAILDYKMLMASANTETTPGNISGNPGPFPVWRFGAVSAQAFNELAEKEGFDFTQNLHLYDTKVLFVYSEWNKAYGLQHAQKVSAAYSNVQLEEIKGSGHEMIYFGWASFRPLALNYFNNLK